MKGIYKIRNKVNGKVYIGKSIDIEERWNEHKEMLATGTHHSYKLQKDYNTYGLLCFEFEVIKDITNEDYNYYKCRMMLLAYEGYYMKQYNSIKEGYNVEFTLNEILFTDRPIFDNVNANKIKYIDMKLALLKYYENIQYNNGEYKEEYHISISKKRITTANRNYLKNILIDYMLDRPYKEIVNLLVNDCKMIVNDQVAKELQGHLTFKKRKDEFLLYVDEELKQVIIQFLKENKIITRKRVDLHYKVDYKQKKLVYTD